MDFRSAVLGSILETLGNTKKADHTSKSGSNNQCYGIESYQYKHFQVIVYMSKEFKWFIIIEAKLISIL